MRRYMNSPPKMSEFPDVVFRVELDGEIWFVSADYLGGGNYQQWGASREALGANVDTVEAWARAKQEAETEDA